MLRRRWAISWKLREKARKILALEEGTIKKDPGGRLSVALVYPNHYSPAISNLGFQTVYRLLNSMEDVLAERAFLPDYDDITEFERSGTKLFTLESGRSLKDFDIVAFSISFEEDYLNIPLILELSGIELQALRRSGAEPFVMAGGIATSLNPWPIADFMDLFLVGEAEGAVEEFMGSYRAALEAGQGGRGNATARQGLLRGLDSLDFTLVPSFYEMEYSDEGVLTKIKSGEGVKTKVRAKKNLSLSDFIIPENFIRTPLGVFKEASLIEIERGCGRACRFCAAGFVCLPPRERELECVLESVRKGAHATGKVGLVGTAVSDYSNLTAVVEEGVKAGAGITLSSLRLDVLTEEKLRLLKDSGYKTVTLAPEAGSQRMRDVINKGLTEDEILGAVAMVAEAGFRKMKFYFLFGLPTETDDDAVAIVELTRKIHALAKGGAITISLNPFIPKPFTPFQWAAFENAEVLKRRLRLIKGGLKQLKGVRLKAMPVAAAFFQAYMARADARARGLIMDARELGMRRAVKKNSAFMERELYRERTLDEPLPWDIIDHGIRKKYFWSEYRKGLAGRHTRPCAPGCTRCGVCPPPAR